MILPPLVPDLGLLAWRRIDARGQACVSCHSPDGIELSTYGFARSDVLRRAARHLPADAAGQIVTMLSRRPAKADAMVDRPLQPGGLVLEGDTPASRDATFVRLLPSVAPMLAEGRVDSEAAALRVRDEMLRIDLSKLRIGIPFNRLSEDGFHGVDHRTVANWLPDVPVRGISPEVEDRYLADPSDDNFRAMDVSVKASIPSATTPAELLAIAKFRSLLILQHRLRTGQMLSPSFPHAVGLNLNPFWDVADFARRYEDESSIDSLHLPAEIADGKREGPAFREQLKAMRLPWFWLGWTLDPALQSSGLDGETQRGDYFVRSLWRDGPYPGHLVLMITKKLIEQGCNPARWNNRRFPQRYEMSLSGLILGDDLQNRRLPPGEDRRRFERLAVNAIRTALFLSRKSVRETGEAFHPEAQANQARRAQEYLRRIDPRRGDDGLVNDLVARLARAKPLR